MKSLYTNSQQLSVWNINNINNSDNNNIIWTQETKKKKTYKVNYSEVTFWNFERENSWKEGEKDE